MNRIATLCAASLLWLAIGMPAPAQAQATLELDIVTGSDDLRGDGNNLRVLILGKGRQIVLRDDNVNTSASLPANSRRHFSLPFDGSFASIAEIELALTYRARRNDFEGNDNWDMVSLRVAAQFDGVERVLYDSSGQPPIRFTAGNDGKRFSLVRINDECTADAGCRANGYCGGLALCRASDNGDSLRTCQRTGGETCANGSTCHAVHQRCEVPLTDPDHDHDGHRSREQGGADCDDNDPDRYPGHAEVCDNEGHDEDCDYDTSGERDIDGDGHKDAMCFNWMPPPSR